MFKTPAKLKNFILWCQKNKVKSFQSSDISFELSELAFVPEMTSVDEINLDDPKTFSDFSHLDDKNEADELLFWSSGKKG